MDVRESNDLALGHEKDIGGDGGASSELADSGKETFPRLMEEFRLLSFCFWSPKLGGILIIHLRNGRRGKY